MATVASSRVTELSKRPTSYVRHLAGFLLACFTGWVMSMLTPIYFALHFHASIPGNQSAPKR